MKKTLEGLVAKISGDEGGKIKGGFGSIKGGAGFFPPPNDGCTNTIVCSNDNNACTNSGDCSNSTNGGCTNSTCAIN